MRLSVLNGTNAVGMNGTNAAPLNGYEDADRYLFAVMPELMDGTNAVGMNGTNAVGMNGTNAAPLNGYVDIQGGNSYAIQGYDGNYYDVSELALMTADQVPMQGTETWSEDDREAYRLAYLYGDPAALYEPLDGFRERRAQRRAEREAKKAAREARRAGRQERRARRSEARTAKAESGTGFFDKFGTALKDVGAGLSAKLQAEAELADMGIEPDAGVLDERVFLSESEGGGGSGIMGWWQTAPTYQKVGAGIALAALAYGIYKVATGKKRRK